MKQLASNRLLSQWLAAAAPGRLPERSSLDAVTLSAFMQNGLIAAIDGTAAGKIRAAGTRMGTVLPSALPGEAFLSLWRDHDRPAVAPAKAG